MKKLVQFLILFSVAITGFLFGLWYFAPYDYNLYPVFVFPVLVLVILWLFLVCYILYLRYILKLSPEDSGNKFQEVWFK